MKILRVLEGTRVRCLRPGAPGILPSIFSNKVISRWNLLDQRTVDASSINAFKSRLISWTAGWASSWTRPLSPRPHWLGNLVVRLYEVNHKVNHKQLFCVKLKQHTKTYIAHVSTCPIRGLTLPLRSIVTASQMSHNFKYSMALSMITVACHHIQCPVMLITNQFSKTIVYIHDENDILIIISHDIGMPIHPNRLQYYLALG